MNSNLKGLRAKFDIKQSMIANYLKITPQTYSKKEKKGLFTQIEQDKIYKFLLNYDASITKSEVF